MLEQKINEVFGDDEPSGFGTGWWSGVLSAFFGILALGAVVCLHFPQLLTSPELRPFYPVHVMRILIQGVILGAILFGVISAMLRFFLAVLVADLAEYGVHRLFHTVPWLWRFHAIHHSSKNLDWIAGSRSHLVDDVAVRGFMLIPMMFVFPHDMIVAYLLFVTIHATWTHCNFGPTLRWLEPFVILPRYHHWHHTSQEEA